MSKYDLSILMPARNEEWLLPTIQGILKNRRANTEIVVILDGQWPIEPIPDHPDVTLIHHSESIGQRAATNEAARIASGEWVMKLDAHVIVDEGFDAKLIADAEYPNIYVPRMFNLHAFDWECTACHNRTYQGPRPTKCGECKATNFERVTVWQPRWHRMTDSMCFDRDLHFQYFREYSKRPEGKPEITDTMSILGAGWFLNRKRYFELGGLDEEHGSWGQMGTEISLKAHLSGARMIATKRTWYAHLFRTQPGWNFPYPQSNAQVQHAREYSQQLWREGRWPMAKRKLSSVVEQYWPVPGWSEQDLEEQMEREEGHKVSFASRQLTTATPAQSATVVYYTDCLCPEPIFSTVQKQLQKSLNGHSLVSVSLKPIDFGNNITLGLERGILTMFQQILAGLAESDSDYVFLCEHDCLYPSEHLQFQPPRDDTFYYNLNVYKVSSETGQAVTYETKQTSGLVANRRLLIDHYRRRIDRVIAEGKYDRRIGFEPGGHQFPRGIDNVRTETFRSAKPIVDIRHTSNLTASRWRQEDFRSQKACQGWELVDGVPGWGVTKGRFNEWLEEVASFQ